MNRFLPLCLILSLTASVALYGAYNNVPKDVSVPLLCTTSNTGGLRVNLKWPSDKLSGGYTIYRKVRTDVGFNVMAELGVADSAWEDTSIEEGIPYEYFIEKVLIKDTLSAYGYASGGWKVGVENSHGHMLLLVDDHVHTALSTQIDQLAKDLWNEGWWVSIQEAPRAEKFDTSAVHRTKNLIRKWYEGLNEEPGYIFIIGRVAVPYSGMVYGGKNQPGPDGHSEHSGAWAADSYYSCMAEEELWLDVGTNTAGVYPDNKNLPGDGRYDNLVVPGSYDIRVGRVDFYNMGLFFHDSTGSGATRHVDSMASEIHLLRNYLERNHAYRSGALNLPSRGLIDDNFGGYGEQFARCAWMSYPALMGANSSFEKDYLSTLDTAGYLWSYGCGGGGSDFQSAGGVGTSFQISSTRLNTIFSMLFGSYFGDWDKANNLLRAPLAAPTCALTNCWAGRPFWFFHPMALGESIGNCYLLSANNRGDYVAGIYTTGIHMALMGDPSLRMNYGKVPVPTNLSVQQVASPKKGVKLTWKAPADADISGYYLYKQNNGSSMQPLNGGAMISETSYLDEQLTDGNVTYAVRAVGVLRSLSATFNELSFPIEQSLVVSSIENTDAGENTLSCQPNPSSQSCSIKLKLSRSAALELAVYSTDGQLVRRLSTNELCSGEQHLIWDLCNDAGQRVADGIYILRAAMGADSRIVKIAVVH